MVAWLPSKEMLVNVNKLCCVPYMVVSNNETGRAEGNRETHYLAILAVTCDRYSGAPADEYRL
jgi:hypothetical protein